jgi:hypothetical protein
VDTVSRLKDVVRGNKMDTVSRLFLSLLMWGVVFTACLVFYFFFSGH